MSCNVYETMQVGDFKLTTSSGRVGSILAVTLAPNRDGGLMVCCAITQNEDWLYFKIATNAEFSGIAQHHAAPRSRLRDSARQGG